MTGASPALSRVVEVHAVEDDRSETEPLAAVSAPWFGVRACCGRCRRVQIAKGRCVRVTRCGVVGSDKRSYLLERYPASWAQEPVMTHLLESLRQNMLEEAPQELQRVELHGTPAPATDFFQRKRTRPASSETRRALEIATRKT